MGRCNGIIHKKVGRKLQVFAFVMFGSDRTAADRYRATVGMVMPAHRITGTGSANVDDDGP